MLFIDKRFSFDRLLFYGNELSLLIFEVLFFGMMDLTLQNYVFDAAMLYLLMEVGKSLFLTLKIWLYDSFVNVFFLLFAL